MPVLRASPIRPQALARAAGETGGPSFGSLLKDAIGSVSRSPVANPTRSRPRMAAGKSNIVDVVTAVSETEVAVSALVSVRDRMIQAYEEIMRMPI